MRKAITIILSFVLFPKPLSSLYIYGGVLVFGSLCTIAYMKDQDRLKANALKDKGSDTQAETEHLLATKEVKI